jgi:hypothetical protein
MLDPSIEVVIGALAHAVVVELDEQGIKDTSLDDVLHLEILVNERAFGRSREQILLARLLLNEVTEPVDHGDIASLVICRDISVRLGIVEKATLTELVLNIKVETIKRKVLLPGVGAAIAVVEGSRLRPPRLLVGAKGTPDEVGKFHALRGARDGVV